MSRKGRREIKEAGAIDFKNKGALLEQLWSTVHGWHMQFPSRALISKLTSHDQDYTHPRPDQTIGCSARPLELLDVIHHAQRRSNTCCHIRLYPCTCFWRSPFSSSLSFFVDVFVVVVFLFLSTVNSRRLQRSFRGNPRIALALQGKNKTLDEKGLYDMIERGGGLDGPVEGEGIINGVDGAGFGVLPKLDDASRTKLEDDLLDGVHVTFHNLGED